MWQDLSNNKHTSLAYIYIPITGHKMHTDTKDDQMMSSSMPS